MVDPKKRQSNIDYGSFFYNGADLDQNITSNDDDDDDDDGGGRIEGQNSIMVLVLRYTASHWLEGQVKLRNGVHGRHGGLQSHAGEPG
jgi:hypothetical protein